MPISLPVIRVSSGLWLHGLELDLGIRGRLCWEKTSLGMLRKDNQSWALWCRVSAYCGMGREGEIFHLLAVCWYKNCPLTFAFSSAGFDHSTATSILRPLGACRLLAGDAWASATVDPGDTCSPVGSGTLEKLDALNFTFTVVVLGLCDGFLGSCSILVTQDKR